MASRLSITPGKARIGGNHAFGRHVMPAAGQAGAQVLVKRGADEGGKVEAGEVEVSHLRSM
jgi:hypothetical protein